MKEIIKTVKFQQKGTNNLMTIPSEIMKEYGLKDGDTLLVKFDGEKITAQKC